MPAQKRVKSDGHKLRIVGVITSEADLRLAARMPSPPDLLELRLDCLSNVNDLEQKARDLPVPLIITARHPAEGGKHNLTPSARRALLLRFLPKAQYVDVELRSIRACRTIIERAHRIGVRTIISFHDLETTPTLGSLRAKTQRAARFRPAILKVATRTDTPLQLGRLLQFVSIKPLGLPIAAMGIGQLGAISRMLLSQCGSVLAYTSLRESEVEGQLTLEQFRVALRQMKR
jgi:3-dehydroquinate dehydratase-1